MAFCTPQDVSDITGTPLTSEDDTLPNRIDNEALLERAIASADRRINRFLRLNSLSTSPTPTPDDLKDASMYYAASIILNRHRTDGTLPERYQAEGLSEQYNPGAVIKEYTQVAEQALKDYAQDQVGDYNASFRIVGSRGERVGSHEQMETWDEDET